MRRKIFHKEIADPPCANTADAINFAGKRVGFSAVALRRRVLSIKGGMEGGIEEEEGHKVEQEGNKGRKP